MEQNRNKECHQARRLPWQGCAIRRWSRETAARPHGSPTLAAGNSRGPGALYAEITAKIIAQLEAGRIPWVQPWTASAGAPGMPANAATGRSYSGINVLMLWAAAAERGYASHRWLTFRQALALGGNVRRGERATMVVYVDRFVPEDERRRAAEAKEEARTTAFLKQFQVFSVEQCEGLPEELRGGAPRRADPMEPWMEALILG